jgi:hypothetical protein
MKTLSPGINRIINVQGINNSNEVIYQGEIFHVTIIENEINDLGTIQCYPQTRSNATLSGTYFITRMNGQENGGNVTNLAASSSTITFDGAGRALITDINRVSVNQSSTYSITSDGIYTNGNEVGFVSRDG